MTNPNIVKIRIIKVSGTQLRENKKAKLLLDRHMIFEKYRDGIFHLKVNRYVIDNSHIKRDKKGKAVIGIDLKTHKSFDLGTNKDVDAEIINTLSFLVDEKYHEANMKVPKMKKWEKIAYMLAGMGLIYFITQIIRAVLGTGIGGLF